MNNKRDENNSWIYLLDAEPPIIDVYICQYELFVLCALIITDNVLLQKKKTTPKANIISSSYRTFVSFVLVKFKFVLVCNLEQNKKSKKNILLRKVIHSRT